MEKILTILLNYFGQGGLLKGSWKTKIGGYVTIVLSWLGPIGEGIVQLGNFLAGEIVDLSQLFGMIGEMQAIGTGAGLTLLATRQKDVSSEDQRSAAFSPAKIRAAEDKLKEDQAELDRLKSLAAKK